MAVNSELLSAIRFEPIDFIKSEVGYLSYLAVQNGPALLVASVSVAIRGSVARGLSKNLVETRSDPWGARLRDP